MREKTLLKNQLNKHVTMNAVYTPISETYLQKTGLRGRKGMLFYALVILLFAIALINLAVSTYFIKLLFLYILETLIVSIGFGFSFILCNIWRNTG